MDCLATDLIIILRSSRLSWAGRFAVDSVELAALLPPPKIRESQLPPELDDDLGFDAFDIMRIEEDIAAP